VPSHGICGVVGSGARGYHGAAISAKCVYELHVVEVVQCLGTCTALSVRGAVALSGGQLDLVGKGTRVVRVPTRGPARPWAARTWAFAQISQPLSHPLRWRV
jgi:hypothetical protein